MASPHAPASRRQKGSRHEHHRGALGLGAQRRLGLDCDDLGEGGRVVREVQAVAGADLNDRAGELRFYEHVIPDCQPKRALLTAIDRSGSWPRIAGGRHPARDTTTAIQDAGSDIQTIDRFGFAASSLEPQIPHVPGTARAPRPTS